MSDLCMIYVTAPSKKEAEEISEKLVSERLAACVNIFDGVKSIYRWEGRLEKSEEAVLIIKTKHALAPEIEKRIKELHSYSCPCIEVVPVEGASEEYAKWVAGETK